MDTTEQRSGFRLPWTERRDQEWREGDAPVPGTPEGDGAPEGADTAEAAEAAEPSDAEAVGPGMAAGAAEPPPSGPRRPSRFLEDLTRAMHVAAEEGRQSALDQFHADGKRTVEEIQARSTDDAAAIRRTADDDVTHVREWSKAEIARIREETERRIAERKEYLDRQLAAQAAIVAREIEHVNEQVASFDRDMAGFFDGLLAEPDPSRFAALAASLPEPPAFSPIPEAERREIEARALAGPEPLEEQLPEPVAELVASEEAVPEAPEAVVAVEAAAEPAADAAAAAAEPVTEATEAMVEGATVEPEAELDEALVVARLAALGDAERAALADVAPGDAADVASHGASLSARLAGLVTPGRSQAAQQAGSEEGPATTTQVIVTGLTSVASIAAFKRQLGRLDGVRSVAVSSGPSEEFVFAVTHGEGQPLADGIASLTGFAPRIDRADAAEIVVGARDPES